LLIPDRCVWLEPRADKAIHETPRIYQMSTFALPKVSVLAIASLALSAATLACNRSEPSPSQQAAPVADANQVHDRAHPLEITVTNDGFVPARAKVKVGEPVTLAVTRKVENTCATEIVIKDYDIDRPLPQGQRVEVTLTPKKAGPIRYACAMDMVSGELVAE
jgi:plastocyanin domain-containing protein